MTVEFKPTDIAQFAERAVKEDIIREQIATFRRGIPYADLDRACTIEDGITRIPESEIDELITIHQRAADAGRLMKFVPASGAASRMFKALLSVQQAIENGELSEETVEAETDDAKTFRQFLQNLPLFPFFKQLDISKDMLASQSFAAGRLALQQMLKESALGFSNLPKGLIPFHQSGDVVRTPFEEHLAEGVAYVCDKNGDVRLHFTVPGAYQERIDTFIRGRINQGEFPDINFEIDYSLQKPSTDTVAVDLQNQPFREAGGSIVFRPGGHGALLENLNDLQGDIIFIKNIDNILPDSRKATTVRYKKALGGYLLRLQSTIFRFLEMLSNSDVAETHLQEMFAFADKELYLSVPEDILSADIAQQREFLVTLFDRPIRVCGMVRNEGEPGGGPFWVRDKHGNCSAQIVESSQIDTSIEAQADIVAKATHFNPVDLVCGVRNYKGQPFDLVDFRDETAGFISKKSKDGRDLKALELPGLWNGAMAFWNTVFVEVPAETFSPVKTVFDLLRPEHRSE